MRRSFVGVVVLAVFAILMGFSSFNAEAKLGGLVENSCQQVFQFNLIQYPKDEKPGGCGQGNRIFSIETADHEHLLVQDGATWDILNCGAGGETPVIQSDFPGNYVVAVMVNGKLNQAEFEIICVEPLSSHDHSSCIVADLVIKNPPGTARFQIVTSDIFDASVETLIWSYEGNTNFKKALFKIYECAP